MTRLRGTKAEFQVNKASGVRTPESEELAVDLEY